MSFEFDSPLENVAPCGLASSPLSYSRYAHPVPVAAANFAPNGVAFRAVPVRVPVAAHHAFPVPVVEQVPAAAASPSVPAAQLAAPLSTAHFSYNGVAKARTLAAAAKAAAANAAAAAEAANAAYAAADARAKALTAIAEAKVAKLQRDLDEVHAAHARIARQATYPCLGN